MLRRKEFLRLLLRILAREKCFFSKAISEEGGVQCGVWETSVEQRVRDDVYASKLKNFCMCDFERLVTRQTHSLIKNFVNGNEVDTEV